MSDTQESLSDLMRRARAGLAGYELLIDAMETRVLDLQSECSAARELLSVHNLGGMTDYNDGPMKRALKAEAELDRERMRLVACGVIALADTPESAAKARQMHSDYTSASLDDVIRRVDECIVLRRELETARMLLAVADARLNGEINRRKQQTTMWQVPEDRRQ